MNTLNQILLFATYIQNYSVKNPTLNRARIIRDDLVDFLTAEQIQVMDAMLLKAERDLKSRNPILDIKDPHKVYPDPILDLNDYIGSGRYMRDVY